MTSEQLDLIKSIEDRKLLLKRTRKAFSFTYDEETRSFLENIYNENTKKLKTEEALLNSLTVDTPTIILDDSLIEITDDYHF